MERPRTSASVNLSAVDSLSSAGSASLTGSQLNVLVARRSALRSQLAVVEQQLAACPPSTASGGGGGVAQPAGATRSLRSGPLRAPITVLQTPARDKSSGATQLKQAIEAKRPAHAVPAVAAVEESLPGAMRPGRYAFWPKRLPASRPRGGGAAAGGVVSGGVGSMPARGPAAMAAASGTATQSFFQAPRC